MNTDKLMDKDRWINGQGRINKGIRIKEFKESWMNGQGLNR